MLSIILGFITGLAGPLSQVASSIFDLQKAKLNTASDIQKAKINADLEEANNRKAVLLAEAGNRLTGGLNAFTRFAMVVGPISYIMKYYLYDKVIGAFVGCAGKTPHALLEVCYKYQTDDLNTQMAVVLTGAVAFYLLWTKK